MKFFIIEKIWTRYITDFCAIQPNEGMVERAFIHGDSIIAIVPDSIIHGWFREHLKSLKIYFLYDISSNYYPGDRVIKMQLDSINNTLILKRDFVIHIACELLDYIPVYPKIPEGIFQAQKSNQLNHYA